MKYEIIIKGATKHFVGNILNYLLSVTLRWSSTHKNEKYKKDFVAALAVSK